jgi:Ca2+-binding RTX toxin-like protein
MSRVPQRIRLALAALASMAVLLPAGASAQAPSWERLGGAAPGGDDLAVIAGTPYVAWSEEDGVHVARLSSANGTWQPVGGAIRHGGDGAVQEASIAADADGNPWVAWTEADADFTTQARVARYDGSGWHEVVGGDSPLNTAQTSASAPQLAFFEGRPYLAWLEDNPSEQVVDAARLATDGSRWEHLRGHATAGDRARLVVSGGNLYLAYVERLAPSPEILRLNSAGDGWDEVTPPNLTGAGNFAFFGAIGDVNGALHLLYSEDETQDGNFDPRVSALQQDDSWQRVGGTVAGPDDSIESIAGDGDVPYIATIVITEDSPFSVGVSRFVNGAWESLPSPSDSGVDAFSAQLAPGGLGGGMFVLFSQFDGETVTWYLAGMGVSVPSLPDIPDPGPGPNPPPQGECSNSIVGTPAADLLSGTQGSDLILGGAGRDRLFGLGGDDCLFGQAGRDGLSGDAGSDRLIGGADGDMLRGGTGADYLGGGSGPDTVYGGPGDDDLNGNSGRDRIFGGRGNDGIGAGSGNDRIDVHGGGSDLVDCGPGRDTVYVSRNDYVRRCERVRLRR